MAPLRRKYTAEYRNHAVKLLRESGQPIAEVARDLGVNERTLTNWVNRARRNESADEKPLTTSERAKESPQYTVTFMCEMLGVGRQGFYE